MGWGINLLLPVQNIEGRCALDCHHKGDSVIGNKYDQDSLDSMIPFPLHD